METGKKQKKHTVNEPAIAYTRNNISHVVGQFLDISPAKLDEPLSRVKIFREGLKKESLECLKSKTGLDYQTLARALSVSSKTLQRTKIFGTVQSEKMYALAGLYALGMSYFGEDGFKAWMNRPLFSLGNRIPLELLDVSEGVTLLRAEIMRLQHGIAL